MSISLGKHSYLNDPYSSGWYDNARLANGEKPNVSIGNYTSIGKNCQFILTHHNYKTVSTCPLFGHVFSRGNIFIGNDVWIGMNVTILDNVTIGDGAVIGAESVVSTNIPAYAIAVGNPCKVIKYRFPESTIHKLLETKWWNLEKDELLFLGIKDNMDVESFIHAAQLYKLSK
jgi:virginiamycin A acetyltransferase